MIIEKAVSIKQLARYPIYLKYLLTLKEQGVKYISSPTIAKALGYSQEQVRKDLQVVTINSGKPKSGRAVDELVNDIELFLGFKDTTSAILVGVGHLGEALINFKGFDEYGLSILAGFDSDDRKIGRIINGKQIFDIKKVTNLAPRLNAHIAILVTPSEVAQEVTDKLIKSGIKAIWNFAPIHINVPDDIVVENVNLASSLAILSHRLNKKIKEN